MNIYVGKNKIKINIKFNFRWRAPRPCGASPTQPYKCSRNVKVNVKIKTNAVLTLILKY